MESETQTEVKFDVVNTLLLISSDEDLMDMYNQKYKVDIKLTIISAKQGSLKDGAVEYFKGIFENVILIRKVYLDSYTQMGSGIEAIAKPVVKSKTNSGNTTPRRYGKVEIMKDVAQQNGKMSEPQRMLLKNNDLKNIYARLNHKGISTIFGDTELSDKECRDIIGAITTLETILKNIL
jgi:hypothetical protein